MKTILLILLCQGAAFASPYVYSNDATDPSESIVTENLIALSEQAWQANVDKFFKKLGCWKKADQIICKDGPNEYVYEPSQEGKAAPAIIMVPVDGIRQGSLFDK